MRQHAQFHSKTGCHRYHIALQFCRNVPLLGGRRSLGDPAYKLVIIFLLPSVLFIGLVFPFKFDLIRKETQISQFCGPVASEQLPECYFLIRVLPLGLQELLSLPLRFCALQQKMTFFSFSPHRRHLPVYASLHPHHSRVPDSQSDPSKCTRSQRYKYLTVIHRVENKITLSDEIRIEFCFLHKERNVLRNMA